MELWLCALMMIDLARGCLHIFSHDSGITSFANVQFKNQGDAQTTIFVIGCIGIIQVSLAATFAFVLYMGIRQMLVPLLLIEVLKGGAVRYMEEYTHKRPTTPLPGRHLHLFTCVMSAAVIIIEMFV